MHDWCSWNGLQDAEVKKEETPVVEEEKKEPELKAIGQEDKEAFKVEVKECNWKKILKALRLS